MGPRAAYPVSVFGILKNPMILMSLVSLGLFVGMPKLMENSKFCPSIHPHILILVLLPTLSRALSSLPAKIRDTVITVTDHGWTQNQ